MSTEVARRLAREAQQKAWAKALFKVTKPFSVKKGGVLVTDCPFEVTKILEGEGGFKVLNFMYGGEVKMCKKFEPSKPVEYVEPLKELIALGYEIEAQEQQ